MIPTRNAAILLLTVTVSALAGACTKNPALEKQRFVQSGDQYVAQKKFPEAIIKYRNAVALDGRSGDTRLRLAAAYVQAGDLQAAYGEYSRAAELMPDNVES